jgi:hypothetical protein
MNFKDHLKLSTLAPLVLVLIGAGVLIFSFFGRGPKTSRYRGLASEGQYFRVLSDFTCAGRRKVQSSITVDSSGFKTKTTNPLDCSEVESYLAPEDVLEVAYDGAHIGFGDALYEKMTGEPNLMETLPPGAELWCRPQSEQAPPMDIYAVQTLEGANLLFQRAEKAADGVLRVSPPVVKAVSRKLFGGRLSYETDRTSLEAQLTSNAGQGKISGQLKAQLPDQFVDLNLICRTSLKHGFLCPIGYVEVPPLKNYLAQSVCISRVEVNSVAQRAQALSTCRAFGRGFDLARTEEWTAALKAVNHTGWNSGGAQEWTKDGKIEGNPNLGFRCVFHPQPEIGESILPMAYEPAGGQTDEVPLEVGLRFKISARSLAKAVRFFRTTADPSGYTVHLWNEKGEALATATSAGTANGASTGAGWQTVPLSEPVVLEAGRTYTVSYYAATGRVPFEPEGLKVDVTRGLSLTGLANGGVSISNGGFPSQASQNNYAVDLLIETVPSTPGSE